MKITPARIVVVGSIIVVGLWLAYSRISFGKSVEKWGVFGDKFGALNTLFTGLGFVGILATLYHQHQEVEGAKKDFAEILSALRGTTEALNKQADLVGLQMNQREKFSDRDRNFEEQYLVKALENEMTAAYTVYSKQVAHHIISTGGVRPMKVQFPDTADYFPIYRGSGAALGRIRDNQLRAQVVAFYTQSTGMLSMLTYNNRFAHSDDPDLFGQRVDYARQLIDAHHRVVATWNSLDSSLTAWFERRQKADLGTSHTAQS